MSDYLESLRSYPLQVTYPHCDWRVLHAPGACQYCDMQPTWQQDRISNKILFTDDPQNDVIIEEILMTGKTNASWSPCPAMLARGKTCQVWGGNRPHPAKENA